LKQVIVVAVFTLGIIPIEMIEYTDQSGCVLELSCGQIFNVHKMHVLSFAPIVYG